MVLARFQIVSTFTCNLYIYIYMLILLMLRSACTAHFGGINPIPKIVYVYIVKSPMFGKSQIRVVDTSGAREKSADSVGQEPPSTGDDRESRGVELSGFFG